jgi:hypothetical protein
VANVVEALLGPHHLLPSEDKQAEDGKQVWNLEITWSEKSGNQQRAELYGFPRHGGCG